MKKICAFFSALCLLALTACSNKNDDSSRSSGNSQSMVSQNNATSSSNSGLNTGEKSEQSSKILIAYFAEAENSAVDAVTSPSVTQINGETKGRMRVLAEMIQSSAGGDLFSIQTSVKYPGDISELINFASGEQSRSERPELTTHIENLEQYDTIFVGYPNWWYDMPMVMYSFFEEYDFSGKTIIPFNSHNGSRFSSTITTIKSLEPNANVIDNGFTVNERDVANSAENIANWIKNLGY